MDELMKQRVIVTDATTITVNGKQNYIRNFWFMLYKKVKKFRINACSKKKYIIIDFLMIFMRIFV